MVGNSWGCGRLSFQFGVTLLLLALSACVSVSFVRTGASLAALPETAPVRVFMTAPPTEPYQEIGVVEVKGGNLEDRVEWASKVAREKGGDAIVFFGSSTGTRGSTTTSLVPTGIHITNSVESYEIQQFVIVRMGGPAPEGLPSGSK